MPRTKPEPLTKFYKEDDDIFEIGVDEVGRGPLFGRVYTGAVILPKDTDFDFTLLKDSKKFTNVKKIKEVAEYIKEHAVSWAVTYKDETIVDKINIRQSVLTSMHDSIKNVMTENKKYFLLVDGNDFKPYMKFENDTFNQIEHKCIEGGDNKYCAIAAASILAKTERDKYIEDLCEEHPELKERYSLDKNKGYGTKLHIEGIKKYGISKWHRKSYGICKEYC
jgi:ribonuclease HII|tara:strand:+ start:511 stop:1176 length:666 start_codon:yes stop_codon:yes gene_type:complete